MDFTIYDSLIPALSDSPTVTELQNHRDWVERARDMMLGRQFYVAEIMIEHISIGCTDQYKLDAVADMKAVHDKADEYTARITELNTRIMDMVKEQIGWNEVENPND